MVQDADRTNHPVITSYESPTDWPWTLSLVVEEARRILSMLENVPEKYRPPESLWHSPLKCKKWIDEHWDTGDKKKGSEGFLEFKDSEIETK